MSEYKVANFSFRAPADIGRKFRYISAVQFRSTTSILLNSVYDYVKAFESEQWTVTEADMLDVEQDETAKFRHNKRLTGTQAPAQSASF